MGKPRPIAERLAEKSKLNPETGCIEYTGPISWTGYGHISTVPRGTALAHRVAYEIAKGPIPDGLQIDHLCRNRKCCNPDHLEAVTPRQNVLRGATIVAANAAKTECARGHALAGDNLYLNGGRRSCRACNREKCRKYHERNRAERLDYMRARKAARAAFADRLGTPE